MKTVCVIRTSNETVTRHIFDLFEKAFLEEGYQVINDIDDPKKDYKYADCYLVSGILTAAKLLFQRKKVLLWVQGISPEESLMVHNSKMRYNILNILERYMLKRCSFCWLVSEHMRNHFENKYQLSIEDKCDILPCYNTKINSTAFYSDNKYTDNIFLYAGGLTVWQCFDQILDIYKRIEEKEDSAKLLLLTKEKQTAKKLIEEKGIKRCVIDYVSPEELPSRIAEAKFGFIIRDDNPVNKVATPTKISSYLSCGIIPIYTSSIGDFADIASSMKYVLQFDSPTYCQHLQDMMNMKIDANDVYNEYSSVFNWYYSDTRYLELLKRRIMTICKDLL